MGGWGGVLAPRRRRRTGTMGRKRSPSAFGWNQLFRAARPPPFSLVNAVMRPVNDKCSGARKCVTG